MAEPSSSSSPKHSRMGAAFAVLGLAASLLSPIRPLEAQGAIGAALEGRVLGRDSTPVEQAIVHVTNTSTGERWQTTTDRSWPILHRVSLGRRALPDRDLGDRLRAGASRFHLPRTRPAADRAVHLDAGGGQARRDHRHHGRPRCRRRAHRSRPDHLRQHHCSACGGPPRLYRAGPPLAPGDQEPERRVCPSPVSTTGTTAFRSTEPTTSIRSAAPAPATERRDGPSGSPRSLRRR